MIRYHEKAGHIESPGSSEAEEFIAPAPRVSVQAFCETAETASIIQTAAEDRRLTKVHLRMQMGGVAAALESYKTSPTPNVVILESEDRGNGMLSGLDELADVCDAGTRVIVIGRHNDVVFYRELIRRGISDYMIAPVTAIDVVRAICSCSTRRTPNRSARYWPWSAPRAASAPLSSPTTSPGRSPATCIWIR